MSPLTLRAARLLSIAASLSIGAGVLGAGGLWGLACAGAPVNPGKRAMLESDGGSNANDPRIERIVVGADAIALIASGEPDRGGAMPDIFVLGRSDTSQRLFLRFSLRLPTTGVMRSASLLLRRTRDIDMAPAAIALHAVRVIDPWDPRSITWPFQPRIEEVRSALTTIPISGPRLIRIDVASIVQHWPERDPNDQGIAVVIDVANATGASFAYISADVPPPELEIMWAYADVDASAPDAGDGGGLRVDGGATEGLRGRGAVTSPKKQ